VLTTLDTRPRSRDTHFMISTVGTRLTAAVLVCMFWCLPSQAQQTVRPAESTAARSVSTVAATGAALDVTQAANWAYRNGIAFSIAAAGTAGQDNPTPQAQPSSPGAPARSRLHPAAKQKRWTAARIAVVVAGVGLTAAGAALVATSSTVYVVPSANCRIGGLPCPAVARWSSEKKVGVVLLGAGVPLSLAGLLVH
jgi:hypothetical protein